MEANRIRHFREKAGLSQTKLACKIGVAASTLNVIENGKLASYPKIRRDLAEVLGIAETEIFPQQKMDILIG
jgi:DNA-binding XRE family transcriptional regulator